MTTRALGAFVAPDGRVVMGLIDVSVTILNGRSIPATGLLSLKAYLNGAEYPAAVLAAPLTPVDVPAGQAGTVRASIQISPSAPDGSYAIQAVLADEGGIEIARSAVSEEAFMKGALPSGSVPITGLHTEDLTFTPRSSFPGGSSLIIAADVAVPKNISFTLQAVLEGLNGAVASESEIAGPFSGIGEKELFRIILPVPLPGGRYLPVFQVNAENSQFAAEGAPIVVEGVTGSIDIIRWYLESTPWMEITSALLGQNVMLNALGGVSSFVDLQLRIIKPDGAVLLPRMNVGPTGDWAATSLSLGPAMAGQYRLQLTLLDGQVVAERTTQIVF